MSAFVKIIFSLAALNAVAAYAQQPVSAPEFNLKQERASTGSNIQRNAVTGLNVPINKAYADLTPEQKKLVKSRYEKMDEADEPPYPLNGVKDLYRVIAKGQDALHLQGELVIFAEINEEGKPTSVGVVKSPDARMSQLVAMELMNEQFKPAICKGQACKMNYPLHITLTTSH
ncbi:hypothetical protein [Undibacterium sp. TJN19]|uniref:hypothetical protein n=1 Tax=Undibacterium sp. TJN19 TaxID=3413055 RepID=UPI003BF21060